MPTTGRSAVGASGASRWIPCPGSVSLSEGMPNLSSVYADEGTVAHSVAEDCLTKNCDAWEFIGEQRVLPVGLEREAQYEKTVDKGMADGVQTYVDFIHSLVKGRGKKIVAFEHHVSLAHIDERCFSTVDCSVIRPTNTLNIADFKYGYDPVEVEMNEQMLYYAVAEYESLEITDRNKIKNIVLNVVQPRAPHRHGSIRSFKLSLDELLHWRDAVLIPALAATLEPRAPRVPGDAQCKYCPARLVCPELRSVVDGVKEASHAGPVAINTTMADEDLGRYMRSEKAIKAFYKALNDEVFRRLNKGTPVEGFKLVDKLGDRVWKDGAVDALTASLPGAPLYTDPAFRSPAQVSGISSTAKAMVAKWAFKPHKGLTVAPAGDTRPAVRRDPSEVFAGVPTTDDKS